MVLAGGVFECQENIQEFLQRLKKVLSPRGRIVGTIYNRDFSGLNPEEGKTYYTAEELVYAAVCQNYEVENIRYIVQNGQQYEYVFVLKPKS